MTIGSVNGKAVIGSTLLVPNVSYKDTLVTITSWSYVGTTITLNVASHTFIAGDYIEVSGLTATTNIPNGVHLVTSVTATTIVFTYALTPTGTAGVSSATVKGYMTTNGRTNGIGEGQTWQNVTASRVAGTTYTNSTGKPIEVFIKLVIVNTSSNSLTVTVDGKTLFPAGALYTLNYPLSFIIPNGITYSITLSAISIVAWFELR